MTDVPGIRMVGWALPQAQIFTVSPRTGQYHLSTEHAFIRHVLVASQ